MTERRLNLWRLVRSPEKLQAPTAFEAYVGCVKGASYGVWYWEGEGLVYESFEGGYTNWQQLLLSPSRAQWRHFWRSMDKIAVWEWASWYGPSERYEPDSVIRDGTLWSLSLAQAGRQVESSGDSVGPDAQDLDESQPFARFCDAVSRLLGGREFG